MKPIYKPSGKAKEYGDLAINIYTGCPHRCTYCYSPKVLHMDKETFHSCVEPRKDIVHKVAKQLERMNVKDKLIHLCFTCDPYPTGYDTTPTREIIKLIKNSGNHVQILTKSCEGRDLDLLDENDRFGVTISCGWDIAESREPNAATPNLRLQVLKEASEQGIKTWLSCEPVLQEQLIYELIKGTYGSFIDEYKIGKLNYEKSNINWHDFGHECERLCKLYGRNYYIKEGLRKEMDAEFTRKVGER